MRSYLILSQCHRNIPSSIFKEKLGRAISHARMEPDDNARVASNNKREQEGEREGMRDREREGVDEGITERVGITTAY